jgi:ribosome hibernation promoting factor
MQCGSVRHFAQGRGKDNSQHRDKSRSQGQISDAASIPSPNQRHTMRIQFHIRGLNISAGSRRWLEQSLEELRDRISVSFAVAVLDHTRNGGPPFTVRVHLAVPGPDIHAEARDHTLQAAWRKVCKNLEKQIDRRKSRQAARATNSERRVRKVRRGLPRIGNMAK